MEGPQPAGVGGWLLLFCIGLPLNMLFAFYHYAVAMLVALHARAFFPVVLPYCVLGVPISLLGLFAVFLLLMRQRSAIFFVKLFLILYAAHSLLVSVLAFALAPPAMPPAIDVWYRSLEFRFVKILGFCVVWFWYFVASQRVKNTYGSAAKT